MNASRAYAGSTDPAAVALSPLFNSHEQLCDTYLEEAGDDILVNEGRELRAALEAAGVKVEYHETPGCFHDFPLVGWLPEARVARARQVTWFNRILG